ILTIERDIQDKTSEQIDKSQREYYLREQMNTIADELGEGDDPRNEAIVYREKILKLKLCEETTEKLLKETDRLSKMQASSQEATVVRSYLDICLDLPWNIETKDNLNIKKAETILNRDHYGLEKVKERILEMLAVRKLSPDIKGQIICLVGPPGVGKTSIAKSIAECIGRKYARLSLGGMRDEAEIRGHRRTYIGAMPGKLITTISQTKTSNPLILLDEIDKLANDFRGDPAAALLEVLDPEQNVAFRDNYLDIPYDLSNVLFLTTANTLDTIPRPLLDRMDVIELHSYTREEKFNIAKRHLIPKQLEKAGLKGLVKFNNTSIYRLIDAYTQEAGVRNLERTIAEVLRKCAKKIASDEIKEFNLTANAIETLLGPERRKPTFFNRTNSVGIANGLAWTSVGGEILPLEVEVIENGKGVLELTGSLGDVMKESAKLALTYAKVHAKDYNIDASRFEKVDIHIHAPEGAVPKDGPSAGVALSTALVSALSGYPVRSDVAMTGEITLHGVVLPIGGLKEKSMAAYKEGIKTVLIPADNVSDLYEIDKVVKDAVTFIPLITVKQALEFNLIKNNNQAKKDVKSENKIIKSIPNKQQNSPIQ
ncbi:MAG: endopeptidase La, partial [Oscillospiraceae bacterium]